MYSKNNRTLRMPMSVAAIILIIQSVGAYAADKVKDYPLAEPNEDTALFYVIRRGAFAGGGRTVFLYIDRSFIGTVDNSTYTYAYVPPGTHMFWTQFDRQPFQLEFEAGEVYFLVIGPGSAEFVSAEEAVDFIDRVGEFAQATDREREVSEKHLGKRYTKIMSEGPRLTVGAQYCKVDILDDAIVGAVNTIVIRSFLVSDTSPYPEEVTDEWETYMPQMLVEELRKVGVDNATVADGISSNSSRGAYELDGEFIEIDKGSAFGRIVTGARGSEVYLRVKASMREIGVAQPVAEFECARASLGGPVGAGGLFAGGSRGKMRRHMREFAEEISGAIAGSEDD